MKLGIFVTHPIPYFVALWRVLAESRDIDLTVYFLSRQGLDVVRSDHFQNEFRWDVDLLSGYKSQFLANLPPERLKNACLPGGGVVFDEGKFDAVLVHGYVHRFSRDVLRLARSRGVKTCVRGPFSSLKNPLGHSLPLRLMRDLYLRRLFQKVDVVFYVGQRAKEEFRRLGVKEEQLVFSPYSVDSRCFERQYQKSDGNRVRKRWGIPESGFVFVVVGALIERKRPLDVVNALADVGDKNDVWVIYVGSGALGDRVKTEGEKVLGEKIVMAGFVNQSSLGDYYQCANALVFPSEYDAWGLVLNEVMQFGVPAIVSDQVSSAGDLVLPGVTGFIYACGDIIGLRQKMTTLLNDRGRAKEMGLAARERVRDCYSVERSAEGVRVGLGLAAGL